MAMSKRQPQERLPLFVLPAARTKYGLSMVGANGLEPRPLDPQSFYLKRIAKSIPWQVL